jgi:hypothetical protein
MRIRPLLVIPMLAGAVALGWALRVHTPPVNSSAPAADEQAEHANELAEPGTAQTPAESPPMPAMLDSPALDSGAPVDVAARARFHEDIREFFTRAPALPEEARLRKGQQLAQELSRLERAGGMSAGETFLLRVGLIQQTVTDKAQQAAQIKALRDRYESETQRRIATASAHADPAFESYKARESEIVAEVMNLQAIPDGLSREEYLRRRLQAAREQFMEGAAR